MGRNAENWCKNKGKVNEEVEGYVLLFIIE